MKIIRLEAENFKRLKAVRIAPNGSLQVISGKNAAGKSSVLDAITAALGGKDAAPSEPIRRGTDQATVVVDLGDMKVTRKFRGDRSTLVVESRDGLRYPSPQAVLDKLLGTLAFDPLAFVRMPAKEQAATLRALVGFDTVQIDANRRFAFDERTAISRDVKALSAQLVAIPEVDAPDDEVSLGQLARQHGEAMQHKQANDGARRRLTLHQETLKKATAGLAAANEALVDAQDRLKAAERSLTAQEYATAELRDPDLDSIAAQMQSAEATNAKVRAKKARAEKAAVLLAAVGKEESLTAKIEAFDDEKAAALAGVTFPVNGLSMDGDAVTFGGLPLAQASSAEQLRVGLAIGAALNPKLRVVLVRDGSLLDENGLRLVAEWAEREGMQVLMERVTTGETCGVVIEDGEVVGQDGVRSAIIVDETAKRRKAWKEPDRGPGAEG